MKQKRTPTSNPFPVELEAVAPTSPAPRSMLEKVRELTAGLDDRKAEPIGLTKSSNSEDLEEFDVASLKHPTGHRVNFHYIPGNYVEYTIALKSVADLCEEMEYLGALDTGSVQVGLQAQQQCIRNGIACHKDEDGMVTLSISTDNESGTYSLAFHSYTKKALQKLIKRYRNLMVSSNFYKGKHLRAHHQGAHPPITFLDVPETPKVYGFKDEQISININTVGFFSCKQVHKISPQWGVLLHGQPGSGKSLLVSKTKAECLAAGITVVELDSSAMQQCAYWYQIVEDWLSPALVVLEDFDLVGESREHGRGTEVVTNDLLSSLNGNRKRKQPIVTLATTNRLAALDSAVVRSRRMDKIFEINGLDPEFKLQLFKQKGLKLPEKELLKAVELLGKNGTGADVEHIVCSTMIYSNSEMPVIQAFEKAVAEWESAHKQKASSMGFAGRDH